MLQIVLILLWEKAIVEEDKWIDYQDIVKKRFELTRQLSLEEALERSDIQVFGRKTR